MNNSQKINQKNKVNYRLLMEKELNSLNSRSPRLLLHSCCAPCSSAVLEQLSGYFDLTLIYYNPNIHPFKEYERRLNEQKRYLSIIGTIPCIEIEYKHDDFLNIIKGYESESEGGTRCFNCFILRLEKTAQFAAINGFEYFTTTLSVSPYKNAHILNDILLDLSEKYGLKPLLADFKKKNGYKRSIELSNLYGIYRQDYCGCEFSIDKKTGGGKE